jgi:hypothetical protein
VTLARFVPTLALVSACATAGSDEIGGDSDAHVGIEPADAAREPDAPPGAPDADTRPDASAGVACDTNVTCAGALTLAAISGDVGTGKQTAQGYQSAWYKLRLTEDEHGIFGRNLSVQVKLTSPPGNDFDVFLYLNQDSDVTQECSVQFGDRSSAGPVDSIHAEWGEGGGLASGGDDARTASIEIRHIAGVCSVAQVWQLEVEGNR